jgi:hypothetical protein
MGKARDLQHMHTKRIDLWRLTRIFLLVLVLPCCLAIAVDLLAGTFPYITIAAILIVFPIAAIVINRTALSELDRVIQEVSRLPGPASEPGGEAS